MSVVWYKVLPAHFGGQKGITKFNEALAKYFPLLCVCSKNNEPGTVSGYQVFNWLPISKTQFINPLLIVRLLLFANRHHITHVVLEHPYHVIAATLLKWSGRSIICHTHNIEYSRWKMSGKKFSSVVRMVESNAYRISDVVMFKTRQDLSFAANKWRLNTEKLLLMPYCIGKPIETDKEKSRELLISRHNIPIDHLVLLFNGTLDYAPNAEAVVNIKKHLVHALRKLNVAFTILITGRLLDPAYQYLETIRAREVNMAGYVDDIDSYFAGADVYINTVNDGQGIQTKTLEALSYNLPVVMFEHMSNGIEKELAGEHLQLVANHNWRAFAEAIVRAAQQTNKPVREQFFEHYSFDRHLPQLVQLINHGK
jgi:polysaccharide biosynthesis protein PslH